MSRIFRFFCLVYLLGLSSCLEISQYISFNDGGKTVINTKIIIFKQTHNLIEKLSGVELLDYKDLITNNTNFIKDLPQDIILESKIINTYEKYGIDILVKGDKSSFIITNNIPFIPQKRLGDIYITLPKLSQMIYDNKTKAILKRLLQSYNYRMILSKKGISMIKRVHFNNLSLQDYIIDLTEYGDIYILEFPLTYLLFTEEEGELHIHFN